MPTTVRQPVTLGSGVVMLSGMAAALAAPVARLEPAARAG